MQDPLYFYTTLLAGIIGLVLAVLLAGLQIRPEEGLQKYNRARWCLLGAFGFFGIMNLMEASLDASAGADSGGYAGCIAIVIGSLLAMLFTMTVLSFIRPQAVHKKKILLQLAAILPPCTLLILLKIYADGPAFKVFFGVMLIAYLLLLFLYTRLFVTSYRTFKTRMLAYYEEEDLVGQMHWINRTFWLALGVGIAALLYLADSPVASGILNVIFIVSFLFIYSFFVNYRPYAQLVDRAVTEDDRTEAPAGQPSENGADPGSADDEALRGTIEEWIGKKEYLDNTKSVDDIAGDLHVYYPALKEYIQRTTGSDFRTWRARLRVEEAERLLAERPDLPISRIATLAGFNDRAYFYRTFQKVTGRSVREYQEELRRKHPESAPES